MIVPFHLRFRRFQGAEMKRGAAFGNERAFTPMRNGGQREEHLLRFGRKDAKARETGSEIGFPEKAFRLLEAEPCVSVSVAKRCQNAGASVSRASRAPSPSGDLRLGR